MENMIITSEILNNMPDEDILSSNNDEYFETIYTEMIHDLATM